tara:strand:- start:5413 stop:6792 length:1380 start_codon:yes stop_codon:yes gene_type:complete
MSKAQLEILLPADEPDQGRTLDLLESADAEGLAEHLEAMSLSDALREILNLSAIDRESVLALLPVELAASLIEEAPTEIAVELLENHEAERASLILRELSSDVQADIIGEFDQEHADAILGEMSAREAADLRRLAAYDDDTAGGLMISEVFTFSKKNTVGQVLKQFVDEDSDFERYRGQHPYVLDSRKRPVGVVSLRSLLTAKKSAPLTEIMVKPMYVTVETPLDDLRDIFDKHAFLGIPVVAQNGRLAGVVSRSAVDMAALERAETESLKLQGVVGEEIRSMPLGIRSRRRLAWLSTNIVLNIIAASVISAYEETLTAVIAIAVFLPMVSDMSGCSGNQAVAVTMRELSLGLVKPMDAMRVWLKEASVGLINGTVLGILIGIVAWAWKGNIYLGLVIGLALCLNTIIAVSIGGVVPLLLRRFGQDPAVASGPLLTTITDMAGFFLVLSLASAFLPFLI